MKHVLFILCFFLSLFIFTNCTFFKSNTQPSTFYVEGPDIFAPNGEKFIMRGVNKMIFFNDRSGEFAYPEIAKTGANITRIFWFTRGTAEELETTIQNCIAQKMVAMPAVWEATGKWEQLQKCVDYWSQPDIAAVIKKYERYVLLNIANEAGSSVDEEEYAEVYKKAITQLRDAGIKTPLVIDAAHWGRGEKYLINRGEEILNHDPHKNIVFSWHPWDPDNDGDRIKRGIDQARAKNLALIIGEFAPKSVGCKCCIAYNYIIDYCQKTGTGWMAWSWGPGNVDCHEMDMTKEGTFETLHDWGLEVAITSKNSIKNTSVRPDIFSEGKKKL